MAKKRKTKKELQKLLDEARASKQTAEEKALAKEAAKKQKEEEKKQREESAAIAWKNRTVHNFISKSGGSNTEQLAAYRGLYESQKHPLFNKINSILVKNQEYREGNDIPFSAFDAKDVSDTTSTLIDIKSLESTLSKMAKLGATVEQISDAAGFDVSKSGLFPTGIGFNKKEISRAISLGGLRDLIIDEISSAAKNVGIEPREELSHRLKPAQQKLAMAQDDFERAKASQRQWKKNQDAEERALKERIRAEKKAQNDILKEQNRQRKEGMAALQERRDNLSDIYARQGKFEQAAKAKRGDFDSSIFGSRWDELSNKEYSVRAGAEKDEFNRREAQRKEEERRQREQQKEDERRRKEEEAEESRRRNELQKKRELFADYQEYKAEREGRRFTETERLGIISGASGRDPEFSGLSVMELAKKVAKAKDEAEDTRADRDEKRQDELSNIRDVKRMVKLLTGINLSTFQTKSIMKKFGGSEMFTKFGAFSRIGLLAALAFKGMTKLSDKYLKEGLESGGELSKGKWVMDLSGMSPEERFGVRRESIASRKYGVSNEDILKARQRYKEGQAGLYKNDDSFFKPLWEAGLDVTGAESSEEFEQKLEEFLKSKSVKEPMKINVMRSLGRSAEYYKFIKNRTAEIGRISESDVQQDIEADRRQEALHMGRSEIERRYEAEKKMISSEDYGMAEWIAKPFLHFKNWMTLRNEIASLNYDRRTGSARFLGGRNRAFGYDFKEVTPPTIENDLSPSPPNISDVDNETQRINGDSASRGSKNVKNEVTVNAEYNITGSKENAERLKEAVEESQSGLAASISNEINTSEIGGR